MDRDLQRRAVLLKPAERTVDLPHHRRPTPHAGFTLIELLIVVAIIGVLATMLIPNLMDALQKAKQKRTVADIQVTGISLMAWLTDQAGAGAAGLGGTIAMVDYPVITHEDLTAYLVDRYIQEVPLRDGWKHPFDYRLDPLARNVAFAIRSAGRDSAFSADTYTALPFDPTDYNQDIVWADGFFVRWPQKVTN